MAEYIDREAAVNGIAKIINDSDMPEDWNKGMSAAMSALFRIPAADVRPVEHGVWRKIKYRSICRDCSFRGFASWNYCPNCGRQMSAEGVARMGGEDDV